MITAFDIYLMAMADSIKYLFGTLSIIFGITLVITIMSILHIKASFSWENENTIKKILEPNLTFWINIFKKVIILLSVSFLLWCFIPGTKVVITMYAVPTVLNNEKLQQLPDVFLDYLIKEFTPDDHKGSKNDL